MTFGKKLRQIRLDHDLTPAEMQERLHVTQSTYSRLETDKTKPHSDLIERIAEEFNADAEWLSGSYGGAYSDAIKRNDQRVLNKKNDMSVLIEMMNQQLELMRSLLLKVSGG